MFPSLTTQEQLKSIESWSPTAYADSTGHSIGWGHFIDPGTEGYLLTATIDKVKGQQLFDADLAEAVAFIKRRITIPLNQNQLDALVLLLYNAGSYPITDGTLDNLINGYAGEQAIRAKWMEYNKTHTADGKLIVSSNLTQRRHDEADLYFTPVGSITPYQKKKSGSGSASASASQH